MLFFLSVCALHISAQLKPEILEYVAKYKDIAIEEMVRTNIPASITLAQGILESGCGKSELSLKANNHFGIKCKDEWTGKRFHQDDDAPNECFRVYESVRESYADHSDFLLTRSRYANLFTLPAGDYKSWAYGLKDAGYATNPKYASILIGYIETYQLHEYDNIGYAIIQNNEKLIAYTPNRDVVTAQAKEPVEVKHFSTSKPNSREEFLINGLRTIKASGNEDPFTIAFEYNIGYQHILAFNDLSSGEKFRDGENIFLQPKKTKGESKTYLVGNGENMWSISQKLGIRVKDLYYKNLMQPNDQPLAGEELFLQEKRNSPPKTITYAEYLKSLNINQQPTANSSQFSNSNVYQVQQKDTLYSIAKKFNTTVEKIKELNSIQESSIKTGQTLVITE